MLIADDLQAGVFDGSLLKLSERPSSMPYPRLQTLTKVKSAPPYALLALMFYKCEGGWRLRPRDP